MTDHDHLEFVPGCFRCELSRDELDDAPVAFPAAQLGPFLRAMGDPEGTLAAVVAERDRCLEALEEIADAERVENADPLEWATWAHERAREAVQTNQTQESDA